MSSEHTITKNLSIEFGKEYMYCSEPKCCFKASDQNVLAFNSILEFQSSHTKSHLSFPTKPTLPRPKALLPNPQCLFRQTYISTYSSRAWKSQQPHKASNAIDCHYNGPYESLHLSLERV
jgi:hypothetical protein